jgi:hypothetical protein
MCNGLSSTQWEGAAMKRWFCGLMTLGLVLAVAGQANAQVAQYTYTELDVPGATITQAYGINDKGQIVGDFSDAKWFRKRFLTLGSEPEVSRENTRFP